jgi:glycosyltransferase involved in cell wall biosynthesis
MKQIAILHPSAPPTVGKIEGILYHHIRLLNQAGYYVRVLAGESSEAYYEAAFHHQVEYFSVPEMAAGADNELGNGALLQAAGQKAAFERVRDRLAQRLYSLVREADICLVNNVLTTPKNLVLTAALHRLAERGAVQLTAWCHSLVRPEELPYPDAYPWNLLTRPWPGVRYVTPSLLLRDQLAEILGLNPEEIAVIPLGIDEASLLKLEPITRRLVHELNLPAADPLLLVPTPIQPQRNIGFALQLLAALLRLKPDAALVVTGPPRLDTPTNLHYLETLQNLRQQLGLAGRAFFLFEHGEYGVPLQLTEAVLADFFKLSDLLILPGRGKSFGLPVLAAGLARLPVFAADTPALHRSDGDGYFHIFDPQGDPGRLAQEMADFLEQDPTYHWRRRVVRHFTWEVVFQKYLRPLVEGTG